MNSKAEDLPTPASPRRRMVYGGFFFDVLMIPCLRASTSLGKRVRTDVLRLQKPT
jgi:hypothetical protein